MYIGPWQEFKLAQVLRMKNDLYEGALGPKAELSQMSLKLHNEQCSGSSTRSFSSVQKPFPSFNLNTYYKQWARVERAFSKSELGEGRRKPPLPRQDIRKRQPRELQQKRVSQMRRMYGIGKEDALVLPPLNSRVEKFTSFKPQESEEFEEIAEQVDELLQWVQELPDEISMNSTDFYTKNIVL